MVSLLVCCLRGNYIIYSHQKRARELHKWFEEADRNGNGELEHEELVQLATRFAEQMAGEIQDAPSVVQRLTLTILDLLLSLRKGGVTKNEFVDMYLAIVVPTISFYTKEVNLLDVKSPSRHGGQQQDSSSSYTLEALQRYFDMIQSQNLVDVPLIGSVGSPRGGDGTGPSSYFSNVSREEDAARQIRKSIAWISAKVSGLLDNAIADLDESKITAILVFTQHAVETGNAGISIQSCHDLAKRSLQMIEELRKIDDLMARWVPPLPCGSDPAAASSPKPSHQQLLTTTSAKHVRKVQQRIHKRQVQNQSPKHWYVSASPGLLFLNR